MFRNNTCCANSTGEISLNFQNYSYQVKIINGCLQVNFIIRHFLHKAWYMIKKLSIHDAVGIPYSK